MKNAILGLLGYLIAILIALGINHSVAGRQLRILWLQKGTATASQLKNALQSPDRRLRLAAVDKLATLSDSSTLHTALVLAVGDIDPAISSAALAIQQQRQLPLPALGTACQTLITSSDLQQRRRGARALALLLPTAPNAIDLFYPLLADTDADLRLAAAQAFQAIGPEDHALLKPLLAHAKDKNLYVRNRSIQAIGQIGPKAASAADTLITLAQQGDYAIRRHPLEALTNIGAPAVPAVINAWKTASGDTLGDLGTILIRLGPEAKSAIPTLRTTIDAPNSERRLATGRIWSAIDPASSLAALRPLIRHKDPDQRRDAINNLGYLPEATLTPALPDILRALSDDVPAVRIAALNTLLAMPEASVANQAAIKALAKDPDKDVRAAYKAATEMM